MKSPKQLRAMYLSELQAIVDGCYPGSDTWHLAWPIFEQRRRLADKKQIWMCFGISAAIACLALYRTSKIGHSY